MDSATPLPVAGLCWRRWRVMSVLFLLTVIQCFERLDKRAKCVTELFVFCRFVLRHVGCEDAAVWVIKEGKYATGP